MERTAGTEEALYPTAFALATERGGNVRSRKS